MPSKRTPMAEAAAQVAAPPAQEAQSDGARAIFDALTVKAREREVSSERNVAARRVEQDAQEEAKKARIRDAKGRFVIEMPTSNKQDQKPAAKVEPVVAPKAHTESPKAETNGKAGVTEEPESEADATAKELALTALRRAKVPKGVIDGMKSKEWIQWGSELHEIQSNTDRLTKEYRELKKQAEDEAKKPKSETRAEPATAATVSADLATAIKAFDDAGPEFGKALRDALAIQEKIAEAKLGEQEKTIKGLSDSLNAIRIDGLIAAARTELVDRFPQLRNKESSRKVLARMDRLAGDARAYESYGEPLERMVECMKDACQIEFKDDIDLQEISDAKETDRKRLGGQLTVPSQTSRVSSEPRKGKDRGEQIYWLMAEGLTAEEARARVDGLR